MPKTGDGEYELILGNRQLLSIFFIVVVLLGAGFTLGYLLGRESAGGPKTEARQVDPIAEKLPDPIVDPPESEAPALPVKAEPVIAKPSAAPATEDGRTAIGPFRSGMPPAGTSFIQVAAVSRQDAEMQAKSLAEKGFPMWVAPNEKSPDLFSVLAGPYAERADLAKAKVALEELGFRKTFRKDFK
jgi:cell division septation protein DedD